MLRQVVSKAPLKQGLSASRNSREHFVVLFNAQFYGIINSNSIPSKDSSLAFVTSSSHPRLHSTRSDASSLTDIQARNNFPSTDLPTRKSATILRSFSSAPEIPSVGPPTASTSSFPPTTPVADPSSSFSKASSDSSHDLNASEFGQTQEENIEYPESPEEAEAREALRQVLLEASLNLVPRYGWTSRTLAAAAADYGVSPSLAGLFPRREVELVEYFITKMNRRFAETLALPDTQAFLHAEHPRVSQRVRWAVKTRLEMLTEAPWIMSSWPQALAVLARPENIPRGLVLLYDIVDEIWHSAVGDRATGLDWYSKRATLAGVYAATELYMLSDSSPGFQDTWASLDRRLQDAKDFGSYIRARTDTLGSAWSLLKDGLAKSAAVMATVARQRGPRGFSGGSDGFGGVGVGFESGFGRPDGQSAYTPGAAYGYRPTSGDEALSGTDDKAVDDKEGLGILRSVGSDVSSSSPLPSSSPSFSSPEAEIGGTSGERSAPSSSSPDAAASSGASPAVRPGREDSKVAA